MSVFNPSAFNKTIQTLVNELAAYVDQRLPQGTSPADTGKIARRNSSGDVTWDTVSTSDITAAGAATLDARGRLAAGQIPELPLARAKSKLESATPGTVPTGAGNTVTLHTLTGPAVGREFWITCSDPSAKDIRLQFFWDGNTGTPDLDVDLGTLFLNQDSYGNYFALSTPHWHSALGGNNFGGYLRFPMPFSNGAVVKLSATGTHSGNYWSHIAYQPLATSAETPPARLKSTGLRHASAATVPASGLGSTYTFFDLTSALGGWLVWFGLNARSSPVGTANWHFIERDIQFTVDGEGVASYHASGTEDFFKSQFYGQGDTGYDTPVSAITQASEANYVWNAGLDLLTGLEGGLKFNSELKGEWLTETAVDVAALMSFAALYYQAV